MSNIEKLSIFTTDIFKTKVDNHEKIKNHLMEHIYPKFLEDGPNDKQMNVYTDYIPGAAKCHWPLVKNLYRPTIHKFLESIGIDLTLPWKITTREWYTFTDKVTTEFVHDHVGGPTTIQFSAVHYVVLDNESHGTVFVNPCLRMIKNVTPTKNIDHCPDYFLNYKQVPQVTEGDIVFFPSWLDHHTPLHSNGSLRIIVAMNIMLRIDNSDGM